MRKQNEKLRYFTKTVLQKLNESHPLSTSVSALGKYSDKLDEKAKFRFNVLVAIVSDVCLRRLWLLNVDRPRTSKTVTFGKGRY